MTWKYNWKKKKLNEMKKKKTCYRFIFMFYLFIDFYVITRVYIVLIWESWNEGSWMNQEWI